ncbi:MAG: BamA/TamA family outer membrane protein, partial [Ignavibacteriaceae bacterium]
TLVARAAFGYDPAFDISYDRPYLFRKQNIFFNAQFTFQNSINKSEYAKQLYGGDFNERFINGQISFAKRLNLYNMVDVNLGFDYIDNPVFIQGISASNQRIDRQISLGAGYVHDTRDLAQFPSTGVYALVNFSLKGLGMDGINYQIINIDFRDYETAFQKLILKWRFASRLSFGKLVPYHDFSFFGYSQRIRGYFNQEQEGNNTYLTSFEMNYPILRDINMSLKFIPLIPNSLLSYRFGIYCELFADAGAARLTGQSLSINDFNPGYGGGLTFLFLPYNILRLEYAFNPYHHSELIIDIGISF